MGKEKTINKFWTVGSHTYIRNRPSQPLKPPCSFSFESTYWSSSSFLTMPEKLVLFLTIPIFYPS